MAEIPANLVVKLREMTSAGMMDCKKALVETQGDLQAAVDLLRKRGMATAAKKALREARDGVIAQCILPGSRIGVLVEVNCETDFVAKNADFHELAKEISMQVAASSPLYVDIDDVPAEELEKEKDIYRDQMKDSGKPEQVVEKIVEGKLKKYYQEVCLMEQEYIKDPKLTIRDLVKNKIATYGENITVGRFVRYKIGK